MISSDGCIKLFKKVKGSKTGNNDGLRYGNSMDKKEKQKLKGGSIS